MYSQVQVLFRTQTSIFRFTNNSGMLYFFLCLMKLSQIFLKIRYVNISRPRSKFQNIVQVKITNIPSYYEHVQGYLGVLPRESFSPELGLPADGVPDPDHCKMLQH